MVTAMLEALLMPLAKHMSPEKPEEYDPRFEALRNRRQERMTNWVPNLDGSPRSSGVKDIWQLDTSLGAIVRTMAACGMWLHYLGRDKNGMPGGDWWCEMTGDLLGISRATRSGDTPEGAMVAALVALVDSVYESFVEENRKP